MKQFILSFGKAVLVLLLTFNFQLSTFFCFAQTQTPQSFSYQAVVRDAQGNILQNQSVSFKFSIIENSASGNVVYAETQSATTNNLGLVVLAIGNGNVLQGTFSTIQWGNAPHFFKVELDVNGGSNFVEMGTTQLLSVPYALYSENAGNVQTYTAGNGISITGNVVENTAPDQPVSLTGQGATSVSGTYPNFTISSTDTNTTYTAGTGIDITGTIINNTAPDQAVSLIGQGSTTVSGSYPNFTINSTDNNTTYTAGTGINITGTTIENTAPDQPVVLNGTGATTITGTYPNFTISSTDNNTTYTAGTGLTLTGTSFSHNAHTGDVSGTTALTVTGIQGMAVDSTAPTTNQVLQYNGSNWSPTQPSNLISAGNGLNYSGNTLNTVWTQTGNNIYNNNTGRVGIGMNAPTGKLSVQGDTSNVLFEVKDKNGYSVFVVYQDSVQVFVDASGAKANKGCFAVNPKAQQKASNTHYLRITPDSTRIYTGDTIAGFGVRNIGVTETTSYMQLTPSNYFIGHEAGKSITTGKYNSFIGYKAGKSNTIGQNNLFIGLNAGYSNTSGHNNIFLGNLCGYSNLSGGNNVFIGMGAGYKNKCAHFNVLLGDSAGFSIIGSDDTWWPNAFYGDDNICIGYKAGYSITDGFWNVMIGKDAGLFTTTSTGNVFVGSSAGANNTIGADNIFLGFWAGKMNNTGCGNVVIGTMGDDLGGNISENVFIGRNAGYSSSGGYNVFLGNSAGLHSTSGCQNVFLGWHAGFSNVNGNGNVFIGNDAGAYETGSNKLYIANEPTNPPLIYGDFSSKRIGLGTTNPSEALEINGGGNLLFKADDAGDIIFQKNDASQLGRVWTVLDGLNLSSYDNTPDIHIHSSGNVGIGTVSPDSKLDVEGDIRVNNNTFYLRDGTDQNHGIRYTNSFAGYSLDGPIIFCWGSGALGTVGPDAVALKWDYYNRVGINRSPTTNNLEVEGNASKTTAGSWLANSDKRIKTDIQNIENAYEIILKLHPIKFRYTSEWIKKHPTIEDKYYYNFIAQEYKEIFPESVKGSGEFLDGDDKEILQIDTYNAQIYTIKAVQELILENRELKKDNELLKAEIENIKTILNVKTKN